MHIVYARELYRALPGACRYPICKPHWKLLLEATSAVVKRAPTTPLSLNPKPCVMEKQIHAEKLGANMFEKKQDPHIFIPKPELPYEMSDF